MSKRNNISEQIRKYLNGELDAYAMHQLEKEAQNDPFLMEALEGYEKTGTGQQNNIEDIHTRLKSRVNKKEARVIPWRIISIAASIFIALTIGGLWLKYRQPAPESKIVAKMVLPPAKKVPADTAHLKQTLVATLRPKERPKTIVPRGAGKPRAKAENLTNTYTNAEINTSAPVGNADTKVAEYTPASSLKKDSTSLASRDVAANTYKSLMGKAAGVAILPQAAFGIKRKAITGIVKDNTAPLPGVSVKIKGTNIAAVTDANGKFTLPSVPDKAVLDLAFVGYEKKEINANNRDSLVIAMQPNNNSLNEVVIVGYGTRKEQEYQPAQPAAGWDGYKKYLKDNAISPDGKTGTVKLSFMVNTDNSLSGFKIINSISAKTDSAAINLVTNGPDWQKSNTGKPEKVKLRIKFTAKQ